MSDKTDHVRGICYDPLRVRTVIGGEIEGVSERGCLLVVDDSKKSPEFAPNSKVILNLLDEDSGRSVNVAARLVQVSYIKRTWVYHLRWAALPELWEAKTARSA